ncbi:XAC0095 family protein [Rhodanobacter umsongensis]
MSTFDSDDLETTGYFLPEDSQLRLKQLREYVGFLTHLARPRRPDEDQEWFSEIRPGEVAICMELLEEQIGQVLDELSWPAERGERTGACEADAHTNADADAEEYTEAAEPEAAKPVMDEAGNRYLFAVTLDQIDEINLLLESLRALGNVVTCSDHAELSDVTLSIMGDAIVRDVMKLRDIIDDVNAQELEPPHGTKPGVREEWATYLALPARSPMGRASHIVRQLPTYQ